MPQLILGGRVAERMVWSAAAGPEIQPAESVGGTDLGSQLKWGAGLGFLLGDARHVQLGPEIERGRHLQEPGQAHHQRRAPRSTPATGSSTISRSGSASGPGLTSGVGTPDFRGVLMVAYTPEPKRRLDRDGDGIFDDDDACPDVKGVRTDNPKTNGCPPPADRDGDGILDDDDACPDVKGVAQRRPEEERLPLAQGPRRRRHRRRRGRLPRRQGRAHRRSQDQRLPPPPADRDGDGIPDSQDACPDVKGVKTDDPKTNGCPPHVDTDGDGIFDDEDACPNEKGVRTSDPKNNGCPKSVRVTDNEIFILEQVQFDTGKATIKKVSDGLLDEVASVLKEHTGDHQARGAGPHRQQGHRGGQQAALAGPRRRRHEGLSSAASTRPASRPGATARTSPSASNGDDAGRSKNRRVQFAIVERKKKK